MSRPERAAAITACALIIGGLAATAIGYGLQIWTR